MHRRELARARVCLPVGDAAEGCQVHSRCHQEPGLVVSVREPELVLELHVEACPEGDEVDFQEAAAFEGVAKMVHVARLGKVHRNGLATSPRKEHKPTRQLFVELHLLAGQLLARQDLLRRFKVDLDKWSLVQYVEVRSHCEIVAVVQARYLVVGLALQVPGPVKLTDVQLRRATWPSQCRPRCAKAHGDEAVQVAVVAEVRAE
mmetsp:Transcript_19087/g.53903  ORF Transcript_19087/g.53903 Transcript_19087/m.53903 type:complete len:204 (-) Transcript_19087:622-1233(-)